MYKTHWEWFRGLEPSLAFSFAKKVMHGPHLSIMFSNPSQSFLVDDNLAHSSHTKATIGMRGHAPSLP